MKKENKANVEVKENKANAVVKETPEQELARLKAENVMLKNALTTKGTGLNETVTKGIVAVLIGKKTQEAFKAELCNTFPDENVRSTYSGAVSHVKHAVNALIAEGINVPLVCTAVYNTPAGIPKVKVQK
jgi:hypothetical protein